MLRTNIIGTLILAFALSACSGRATLEEQTASASDAVPSPSQAETQVNQDAMESEMLATFGAGCFWCVEAVMEQYDGVLGVSSGYMGGPKPNPSYREVCTGESGHAEVVQVRYDPTRVTFDKLLQTFFEMHDPTTLNRQGADVGTQYRSAVFFHTPEQETAAKAAIVRFAPAFKDPIVTEVSAASEFFEAEDYHQDYYRENRTNPYCQAVIRPKLDKLGLDN